MCDLTTLQKNYKNLFVKKIYHTHNYIILHNTHNCNTLSQKSVDNFPIFFLLCKLEN